MGSIGIIGNLGYFKQSFNADFYLYYTNLSNYICFTVVLVSLVKTIKSFKTNQTGYCETCPKFMCLIMILVTCLVYNILLAKENTVANYFFSITNLIMHLILPIMFTLDWILFSQHGKTKWFYPLLSVIMPLIYVSFIMIRALILGKNFTGVLYPYFFLNISNLGIAGVAKWIVILVAIFVALGYIIYALDNIQTIKQKFLARQRKHDSNKI